MENNHNQPRIFMRDRIMMRMNESGLTPDDWQTLRRARDQVWTKAGVGGILGGSGAYLLLRRRRISPFLMVPLVCGGLMLGSQLGMGLGLRSGMKTIDALPDSDNVKKLAHNLRNDVLAYRGKIYDTTESKIRSMTAEEKQSYEESVQNSRDYFKKHGNKLPWGRKSQRQDVFLEEQNNKPQTEQRMDEALNEQNAWDKVRQDTNGQSKKKTNEWGDPVE
ncbi:hypothetical protein K501DRAFT_286811 [Backusella circina FSU 941]|nr:hypothetical protein K501DRAFT_286811 [Backusella circina FSU 941]